MSAVRRETSVNWLREELREWASWYNGHRTESENIGWGFLSETTLSKHANGRISAPMSASIPPGVMPPRNLERICHAMVCLLPDEFVGYYVNIMRTWYLSGEDMEATRREFGGRSERTIRDCRGRGEDVMRAFLRA